MSETYLKVTGERIVTPVGGFNASWQRHAACYALTAPYLGSGTVLDIGCGTGHALNHLAPRASVGIDLDHSSLVSQPRPTARADMRKLPFKDAAFGSVMCIHAIEHVPDPRRAVAEVARVLRPGAVAVFVTPNRLTFGRPDEIIDPYHYIEFDSFELQELCRTHFEHVVPYGLFGSQRYMDFFSEERRQLAAVLRLDPLKLRRFLSRKTRQILYDWKLSRSRAGDSSLASQFTIEDFELRPVGLETALDVAAICR
ncbi:MAG: class I SAM-dependent methyltransferase [Actinomycetota bacterium]